MHHRNTPAYRVLRLCNPRGDGESFYKHAYIRYILWTYSTCVTTDPPREITGESSPVKSACAVNIIALSLSLSVSVSLSLSLALGLALSLTLSLARRNFYYSIRDRLSRSFTRKGKFCSTTREYLDFVGLDLDLDSRSSSSFFSSTN